MHRIFANLLCPLKMALSLYEYSKDIFILSSVALALALALVVISKVFSLEELVEIKKKNVLVVSRVHETIMHILLTKMTKKTPI